MKLVPRDTAAAPRIKVTEKAQTIPTNKLFLDDPEYRALDIDFRPGATAMRSQQVRALFATKVVRNNATV